MNFELTSACNSAKELIKDESYFANLNKRMTYEEFLEFLPKNKTTKENEMENIEIFLAPNIDI